MAKAKSKKEAKTKAKRPVEASIRVTIPGATSMGRQPKTFGVKEVPYQRKTDREYKTPVGRPPADIDWEEVARLSRLQLTPEEIGAIMRIPRETLIGRKEFGPIYKEAWANMQKRVRRAQLLAAVKDRNPSVLIWMGKQLLGQREPRQEFFVDGNAAVGGIGPRPELMKLLTDEELELLEQLEIKVRGRLEKQQRLEATKDEDAITVEGKTVK